MRCRYGPHRETLLGENAIHSYNAALRWLLGNGGSMVIGTHFPDYISGNSVPLIPHLMPQFGARKEVRSIDMPEETPIGITPGPHCWVPLRQTGGARVEVFG
jgi:hypothetical protein